MEAGAQAAASRAGCPSIVLGALVWRWTCRPGVADDLIYPCEPGSWLAQELLSPASYEVFFFRPKFVKSVTHITI